MCGGSGCTVEVRAEPTAHLEKERRRGGVLMEVGWNSPKFYTVLVCNETICRVLTISCRE